MNITITVRHVISFDPPLPGVTLDDLAKLRTELMATIQELEDALTAAETSFDAAATRVTNDLDSLHKQIADLQTQVDAGTAPQAIIDRLVALKSKAETLDAAVNPQPQINIVNPPEPEPATN